MTDRSDKVCGNCANFRVLGDRLGGPYERFGVCWLELERDLDYECGTSETLDWAYDYGRYGDDDCEKPDEWFEEEGE